MRMYDIIDKKREKGALTKEEIRFFLSGFATGEIPDYQASALLMAICCNGMTDGEILDLTQAMATSGDTLDLSSLENTVDKHSTGGVGDKATLIVAPIAAALGGTVAKMSGSGLGHTGGTVDKLESIPGFCTELEPQKFMENAKKYGICVIGQSGDFNPADKKLYALRDVTATVKSIPLITSSIMSKKLSAGAHNIVLDVTVGSGAFITDPADARILAEKMVSIGKAAGRNIAAVMTNMNAPLGKNVGNSLEVIEAVEVLRGKGPADLREVCLALAGEMVALFSGKDADDCHALCEKALDDGSAYAKFLDMVRAQGGDVSYIENTDKFPKAAYSAEVRAEEDGFITKMQTAEIGTASVILGAGREKKGDAIDFAAGLEVLKKTGDSVKKGDVIAILHTNRKEKLPEAERMYLSAISYGNSAKKDPEVYGIVR